MTSCAKEELDSPSQTPEPQVIIKTDTHSIDGTFQHEPIRNGFTPAQINDDGDNEEEGTVAGNSNVDKEPKDK